MEALKQSILERVKAFPGHTSFYFKDLTSGDSFSYNSDEPMGAASVIKLTVMAELFRQIDAGMVSREQKLTVTQISEELGFTSIHYFCRLFKKETGMTPKEYIHTTQT